MVSPKSSCQIRKARVHSMLGGLPSWTNIAANSPLPHKGTPIFATLASDSLMAQDQPYSFVCCGYAHIYQSCKQTGVGVHDPVMVQTSEFHQEMSSHDREWCMYPSLVLLRF